MTSDGRFAARQVVARLALCCALGCALVATPAAADEVAPASYEQTIAAALRLYGARDWAAARAAFEQAHALDPGARTARGIGLSAYYAQDYVAAARAFEQALSDSRRALNPEQRRQTEQLLSEVHARVARVRVQARPEGAQITVNDEGVGNGVSQAFAPGRHRLDVRLAGHVAHSEELELAPGQLLERELELRSLDLVQPQPQPLAAISSAPPANRARAVVPSAATLARPGAPPVAGGGTLWPWVAAGTTVALAVTALGFGLSAQAELDDLRERCGGACTERKRAALWDDSPIESYETLTNLALVAAGLAAATTVTLFVLEAGSAAGDEPTARVHGVGLLVADRF